MDQGKKENEKLTLWYKYICKLALHKVERTLRKQKSSSNNNKKKRREDDEQKTVYEDMGILERKIVHCCISLWYERELYTRYNTYYDLVSIWERLYSSVRM